MDLKAALKLFRNRFGVHGTHIAGGLAENHHHNRLVYKHFR